METADSILDRFVEGVFRLILEHHQQQVVVMDLTLTQAQALKLLRNSALPTSKLAAALGISAPAVTQLTNRLIRKHLIERRGTESDRRWVNIELTTKGRMVIDSFRERRNEVFSRTLARLEDSDRSEVIDVLRKLTIVMEGSQMGTPASQKTPAAEPSERRTAVEPVSASNSVAQQPTKRPAKRMKIEWD